MTILNATFSTVTIFFTLILSVLVLSKNHKAKINKTFATMGISIILWNICNVIFYIVHDAVSATLFSNLCIVWPIFLPVLFSDLIAELYYKDDKKYQRQQKILIKISCVVIICILFLSQTTLNIKSIVIQPLGINDYQPGILYYFLLVYLISAFSFSFVYLFRVYKNFQEPQKSQAKLMLLGSSITIFMAIITNIILPLIGHDTASDLGPSTVIFFTGFTAFAILRHHLFNIKVIAIEMATAGLWITILVRMLVAQSLHEMLIELSMLTVTVILGIMLIRGVLMEIVQREKIETLAAKLHVAYDDLKDFNARLEKKVVEQTVEIRASYEVEKRARLELQKLNSAKDQFITSTQHHLRTPLTALKWELETIRKDTRSSANPELAESLDTADASAVELSRVIEDFIAVTEEGVR